jgi:hypothetical protein
MTGYDVIGSGAGGDRLVHRLAPSGKRTRGEDPTETTT